MKITIGDPVLVYKGPTVDVGWGPVQFPHFHRTDDKRIVASFDVCKDLPEDEGSSRKYMISSDNGKNWEEVRKDEENHIISQTGVLLDNGKYLKSVQNPPVATRKNYYKELPNTYFTYIGNLTYGLITPAENIPDDLASKNWEFKTYDPKTKEEETFECKLDYPGQCMFLGKGTDDSHFVLRCFPRSFDPVHAPDGSLWIAHYDYGRNPETMEITLPYYFCSFFQSKDNGRSFSLKSFIPYTPEKLHFPEAFLQEGFCEPCLHFAPNGSMITILRTGSRNFSVSTPTFITRSTDGITWSEPQKFDEIGVWPQLLSLKCGVTLASYGRPGVFLRATDDKSCKIWQDPVEILKDTGENLKDNLPDTCGYTALIDISDTEALMVYTDFTQKDKDGVNRKCVMARSIQIKKD